MELTKARLREFAREPGAVFWVFGFPVLMVVALGLAFRNAPAEPPHVVVEENAPGWVAAALQGAHFVVERRSQQGARESLRSGRSELMISATADGVHYRYDGTRAESRVARALVDDVLQRAQGRLDPLPFNEEQVTEPGSRYVDFLLPGIIGMNLMGSSMWGIGFSIVMSRKRRLLKRFAASPMRRSHFLAAYGLSRLVFLSVELSALVVFGALAFGVTIQGSIVAFCLVALLGAACFAAISLLVGARIQSIEAANGWFNLIQLPMWMLSGSFFSYERFPEVMHPFIQALPLTALNDALRAISAHGASIATLWPQLIVLGVWGTIAFGVSLKLFRWQ